MKKSIFFLAVGTLLFSGVVTADQNYGCPRDGRNNRFNGEAGNNRGQQQDRNWNRDGGNGQFRDRIEQRLNGNGGNGAFRNDRDDDDNDNDNDQGNGRTFSREDFLPKWEERRELRRNVRERIINNLPEGLDITINISRGQVTISGTVDNEQDRQEIKERLRTLLEGAKSVQDKLKVANKDNNDNKQTSNRQRARSDIAWGESDASSTSASPEVDGQLMLKIQEALKGGILSKGYDRVTFDVANGDVKLKGAVDSDDDRQAILKKLADIKGIKKIDNQIKVQPVAKSSSY